MAQISPELSDAIGRLTPGARLDLLRAMVNPEPGRMERIHRMKERGDTRDVATLLIEIDDDAWARSIVVEILGASPQP